ncbi:GTP-binding protein [Streptomyces sp. NPDC057702]|uniref:GTP-binding protein n=1 Tax=unclassified Streptomyces TaxID=2593676 RepID=UPI0036AD6B77
MSPHAHDATTPHLNIATLGHARHGKTTLTAAISRVLGARATSDVAPPARSDRALDAAARGALKSTRVEYETGTRHYVHRDMPGDPAAIEHVIGAAAQLDGAILVVSALDGVRAQTVEHVLIARQLGVDHLVVALSQVDAGEDEAMEHIEREIRDLLAAHGYPGTTTPVIRVSALRALEGVPRWIGTIEALTDAVDTFVPTPRRQPGEPFLLPVDHALPRAGHGAVIAGTIERGTVRSGDRVQVLGPDIEMAVASLETFGRPLARAEAGDCVALLLRGVPHAVPRRGDLAAAPGSLTPRRRFTAHVRVLPGAREGAAPFATGHRSRFFLRTAHVDGAINPPGAGAARPGDTLTLDVELSRATPVQPDLRFVIRDDGRTVGAGTVLATEG